METNELPEDVKRKIEDWASLRIENDQSSAEFGYRLGLQSCEEQLKQMKINMGHLANGALGKIDADNARLQEQLKAKDEENERLRGLVRKALLDASQDTFKNFKGEYMMKVFKVYADEWCIENGVPLLSQSTDKP